MSFKKTSDGKVFFKGANANEVREEGDELTPLAGRSLGAETQLQILALLRSLNEKLKNAQAQDLKFDAQLENFRALIETLEQKSDVQASTIAALEKKLGINSANTASPKRNEDVSLETRRELEKTRDALLKLQDGDKSILYRDAPPSALAGAVLASSTPSYAAEPMIPQKRKAFGFSAFYAALLSLMLIGGVITMWAFNNGFILGSTQQPGSVAPAETVQKPDLSNEEQLGRMMETDPDAVAQALNTLEPGTASAQSNAAAHDVHGLIPPDETLPATYKPMEEQAFSGVLEAQHNLGALYTTPKADMKQDYARAAFWFRQAAERGMANAQYNLGVMYQQGLGVPMDIKQAVKWYQAAAAQSHAEAEYNLGIAYIEGMGIDYDPAKAVENFEKAADQGVVEAAYNLGLIYENALLGRADPSKALAWYKRAADQGSPEAQAALQQLAQTLNIEMNDIDRVISESGKI